MKIHRFITSYEINKGTILVEDKELVHQWKNVLKFKIGEEIILTNEDRHEVLAKITELTKTSATLSVLDEYENTKEPTRDVTLYVAILKRENFELVVQKATEVGIQKIVPIITENTVKTGLKYERLEKIAKEAAELCGRSTVPTIVEAMNFNDAIADANGSQMKILFDGSGARVEKIEASSLAIFVGPEGGFTTKEIETATNCGCIVASLGSLTLRGETAAIVASYLAINL